MTEPVETAKTGDSLPKLTVWYVSESFTSLTCRRNAIWPWLGGSVGSSAIPCTKRLRVRFPVRAHYLRRRSDPQSEQEPEAAVRCLFPAFILLPLLSFLLLFLKSTEKHLWVRIWVGGGGHITFSCPLKKNNREGHVAGRCDAPRKHPALRFLGRCPGAGARGPLLEQEPEDKQRTPRPGHRVDNTHRLYPSHSARADHVSRAAAGSLGLGGNQLFPVCAGCRGLGAVSTTLDSP